MEKEITFKTYSSDFFSLHLQQAVSSAENVIPIILNYIKPNSVIDIGCGTGTWLSEWKKKGVNTVIGIDGEYIRHEQLTIDPSEFISYDLSKKYVSDIRYDLVVSLEVAEHIKPDAAGVFVDSLCGLGDIILFSAAIPGQEGTYHFNEQYPIYWAKLFQERGFIPVDCLRKIIWNNDEIAWWYRQNLLFFVRETSLFKYDRLKREYEVTQGNLLSLVHPELFCLKMKELNHFRKIRRSPFHFIGSTLKKIFK